MTIPRLGKSACLAGPLAPDMHVIVHLGKAIRFPSWVRFSPKETLAVAPKSGGHFVPSPHGRLSLSRGIMMGKGVQRTNEGSPVRWRLAAN
jgi:hypothetical protein